MLYCEWTRPWATEESWFDSCVARAGFLSKASRPVLGPSGPPSYSVGTWDWSGWAVKPTAPLHLSSRLRMSTPIYWLAYIASWHVQRHLYLAAMSWPRRFVADLSLRMPGFDPRAVGFVEHKVALGRGFLRELRCFPCYPSTSVSCLPFLRLSLTPLP
jgi:hypothetical protein